MPVERIFLRKIVTLMQRVVISCTPAGNGDMLLREVYTIVLAR